MISENSFINGMTMIEAATGTSFKGRFSETWREEFLRDVSDDAFLGACREIARSWTTMKFPPLSRFLEAVHSGGSVVKKSNQARMLEEEKAVREFDAEVRSLNSILSTMEQDDLKDLAQEVDTYTQKDPYWRSRYGKDPGTLQDSWDTATRMHITGVRKWPWLATLFSRMKLPE